MIMRVLVTVSPWATHYFVVQPLAAAFRAAGHEVLVAVQPSMARLVEQSGLHVAPVGIDVDLIEVRRRTIDAELAAREAPEDVEGAVTAGDDSVLGAWQDATSTNLESIVDLARLWRPDLVIADTMCPPGLVAARLLGVPGIRHLWGWDIFGSSEGEALFELLPGFYEPYQRYGVEVAGDPAVRTIDPIPPSLQPEAGPFRMPVRYTPYNGSSPHPEPPLPPTRGRRVCVTWGRSSTKILGRDSFPLQQAVERLLEAEFDVVIATDGRERASLESALPARVSLIEDCPLHLLLPHTDAVVHQGGAGTVLNAISCGLPQLALTSMADQDNIAAALARAGAAVHVKVEDADAGALRRAVQQLTGGELTSAAIRLRDEMLSQPSPAAVVDELVALTG